MSQRWHRKKHHQNPWDRYPFVWFAQTISVDCLWETLQAYFSGLDIDPEEAAVGAGLGWIFPQPFERGYGTPWN